MAFDDFNGNVNPDADYYDGEPRQFNNVWLGVVLFLLLPFVSLVAIVLLSGSVKIEGAADLLSFMWNNHSGYYTNMFVMSLLPNMMAFFWVYKSERWKLGKGLIIATLSAFFLFVIRDMI